MQVIKDRVYEVTNPQTEAQMVQRVIFATVTKAAEKMADLITISQENQSKETYARQQFISDNIAFLRSVAGRRAGANRHYLAAYAPKGNEQLIPNSYIVSKGSLNLPEWFVPKTTDHAGSFAPEGFAVMGTVGSLPFGTYTVAQLWLLIFGLQAGDQLTFPQIYGDGIAQAMYEGDYDGAGIVDKTLITSFCAPRLVLLREMPTTTVEISANTDIEDVKQALLSGIDTEKTWGELGEQIVGQLIIDETADEVMQFAGSENYGAIYAINNDDPLRAIGCILSRYDGEKWRYSTCQLTCVWDFIAENDGKDYFGFTLSNAIDTFRPSAKTDSDGNFLQRGGEPDIVPSDFQ